MGVGGNDLFLIIVSVLNRTSEAVREGWGNLQLNLWGGMDVFWADPITVGLVFSSSYIEF